MKILRLVFVCSISILLVAGFSLVLQASAAPATAIVVNTTADEVNDDDICSLREAITAANDNSATLGCPAGQSGLDKITFEVSGTIILESTLPDIIFFGGPLVIDGGEVITISGDNSFRVFMVESGAQLTLENITVADGASIDGGGIYNSGTLTVTDSTFSGNSADSTVAASTIVAR